MAMAMEERNGSIAPAPNGVCSDGSSGPARATDAGEDLGTVAALAMRGSCTCDDAASAAAGALAAALGCESGVWFAFDDKSRTLRMSPDSRDGLGRGQPADSELRVREGEGVVGRAARQRDVVVADDLEQVAVCARIEAARAAGFTASVGLPIVVAGRVLGVIELMARRRHAFGAHAVRGMRDAADVVATYVERIDAERRSAERARDAQAVADVLEAIAECVRAEETPVAALEGARKAFGAPFAVLWRSEGPALELQCERTSGSAPSGFEAAISRARVREGDSAAGRAARLCEVVALSDLGLQRDSSLAQTARRHGVREAVAIPLVVDGRAEHVVELFSTEAARTAAERIESIRRAGKLASLELSRRAHERQREAQIQAVADFAGRLGGGEAPTPPAAVDGSVARLAEAVAALGRRARDDGDRVAAGSRSISGSAEQLISATRAMSEGARHTAEQAQLVTAASEGVHANIETVAASAEEMIASIREIAKSAHEAAGVATCAVAVAQTTNTTIAKLGESGAEIGKVIKVITSIAQQTNLLALNATIEAARAGDAGKGFAVVANEVKELAKATAKATEDISQKIEAIQSDTRAAVAAILEIGGIISKIHDFQNTIASAVEEQTATTNEISRNVAEAAQGSAQIAENIATVAKSAGETSTRAEAAQAAVQSVAQGAAELQTAFRRAP